MKKKPSFFIYMLLLWILIRGSIDRYAHQHSEAIIKNHVNTIVSKVLEVHKKVRDADPRSKLKFDQYYKENAWKNSESFSGDGSTVDVNKIRVQFLSTFMRTHNVRNMYDIPCGDANWQYTIEAVQAGDVEYYGSDVSEVALSMAKGKNKRRKHMHFLPSINLIEQIPYVKDPDNSLFLLKEVLQHVPLDDGTKMIENIKASGVRYLAVTNHDKILFHVHENKNVDFGEFYPNNMFLSPFSFNEPVRDVNDLLRTRAEKKKFGNLLIFDLKL